MFSNSALIFSTSTKFSRLGSFFISDILVLLDTSGVANRSFRGDSVFYPMEFDLTVSSSCCPTISCVSLYFPLYC